MGTHGEMPEEADMVGAWVQEMEQELQAWASDWDVCEVQREARNVVARGRGWDCWDEMSSWEACLAEYGTAEQARQAYEQEWTRWHAEWLACH
jgi:hypothetical protein